MENLQFISELYVPIVMAICLCVGYILKHWTDDKKHRIIPTVLAILGAVCACIYEKSITLEAIASGAVTGLASTGIHQAFKQIIEKKE
ncbi:MAG: phage holin family protein [Clostridia bacterium]|nr:phage holin family protein [Clostridia bacterium]